MDELKKQLLEFNRLCNESSDIYHEIAINYGISDTVHWILYMLYVEGNPLSQAELCEVWHLSKQTVNSSVAVMIKKGWITLVVIPGTRNRKNIILTESGKVFCSQVIKETQEIEEKAFSRFTEQERHLLISLYQKNNQYMREEYRKKHENTTI